MESSPLDKLRAGKAYQVFYSEYRERLLFAQQLLAQPIEPAQRADLKGRFHMLKGGAGFFGFSEIVRIAREIEVLLGLAVLPLNEEGRQQLSDSLQLLEDYYQQMPEPIYLAPEAPQDA